MKKHPYQTCLRMPEVLRDSMTTICEKYQINESDFMRRAIAESVQSHLENGDDMNRKFMFIWSMGIHGYHSDITYRKDTIGIPLVSFSLFNKKVWKNMSPLCSVSAMCRYYFTLSRSFISSSLNPQRWHTTITVWLLAILASSLVDILFDRLDHLVGRPDALRNCLTVDALIPKFTFSGIEPLSFANFILFSWETTTPTMFLKPNRFLGGKNDGIRLK